MINKIILTALLVWVINIGSTHAQCSSDTVTAPGGITNIVFKINDTDPFAYSYYVPAFSYGDTNCFTKTMTIIQSPSSNGISVDTSWSTIFYYNSSQETSISIYTQDNNDESYGDDKGWIYILELVFTNVDDPLITASHFIHVEVKADCLKERINWPASWPPAGMFNDFYNYTIRTTAQPYTITQSMFQATSSRVSCQIQQYRFKPDFQQPGDESCDYIVQLIDEFNFQIYSTNNFCGGEVSDNYGHYNNVSLVAIANITHHQYGDLNGSIQLITINVTKDCSGQYYDDGINNATYLWNSRDGTLNMYVAGKTLAQSWTHELELGCDSWYTWYYYDNDTALPAPGEAYITDYFVNNASQVSTLSYSYKVECLNNRDDIVETSWTNPNGTKIYANVTSFYWKDNGVDVNATGRHMPTTVYIWPNCSLETVDLITPINDFEYKVMSGQHSLTVPEFGTSLPMCNITAYRALVNGSDINDIASPSSITNVFTFDPATRVFTVDINYNSYAGQIFNVTIIGNNSGNVNGASTFFITVQLNCEFATLTVIEHASVADPQYFNYTVNSGPKGLYTLVGTTNDTYCLTGYSFSFENGTQVESNTSYSNAVYFLENSTEQNMFYVECNDNNFYQVETMWPNSTSGIRVITKVFVLNYPATFNDGNAFNHRVHIVPDCTLESISIDTIQANQIYTIFQGPTQYDIHQMGTSRTYCTVYGYSIFVDGIENLSIFDQASMKITVDYNSNLYGNNVYNYSVNAQMIGGNTILSNFTLTTKKDCSTATITEGQFGTATFDYTVEDNQLQIPYPNAQSSDQYCERIYEVYYQTDPMNNPTNFEKFDPNVTNTFIASFNQTNTIVGTDKYINIYTTDQSIITGYEQLTFELYVQISFDTADLGVASQTRKAYVNVTIKSYCTKTIFNNTSKTFYYNIRQPQIMNRIPLIGVSWPTTARSGNQIFMDCGDPQFQFQDQASGTNFSDYSNTVIQEFTLGSWNANDGDTDSFLTLYSANQHLGGGVDASGNYYNTITYNYQIEFFLQKGATQYVSKKGYQFITLVVSDNCWVTQFEEGEFVLEDIYKVPILYHRNYTASRYTHTAQTKFTNQTDGYSQDCGSVTYQMVQIDQSNNQEKALDPSLTYTDSQGVTRNNIEFNPEYSSTEMQLKMYTDNHNLRDITQYLGVKVFFTNEPTYPSRIYPFQVIFSPCDVQQLKDPSVIQPIYHNLWGNEVKRYYIDFSKLKQEPDCQYSQYYTIHKQNDDTGGYGLKNLQMENYKFIQLINKTTDPSNSMYIQIDQNDLRYRDQQVNLIFQVTILHDFDPNALAIHYQANIEFFVEFNYFKLNEAPYYIDFKSQEIEVFFGDTFNLTTGEPSEDIIFSDWDIADELQKRKFLDFTEVEITKDYKIHFVMSPNQAAHFGTYDVKIRIKDNDEPEPKETNYFIRVIVPEEDLSQLNKDTNTFKGVVIGDDQGRSELDNDIQQNQVDEIPLNFKISDMDNEGNIELKFNQPVDTTIFDQLKGLNFTELRKKLLIAVIPGPEQDPLKIEVVNYQIGDYTETDLKIKIKFKNPRYISVKSIMEQLIVRFSEDIEISTKAEKKPLVQHYYIHDRVPQQIDPDTDQFMRQALLLQKGMQSFSFASLLINILWQYPINHVWGMINTLQLTAHCQLINMNTPSNLGVFNNITMKLIYFDILPEEGLEYFYIWKAIDGSYTLMNDQEVNFFDEEITQNNQFSHRLLNQTHTIQNYSLNDIEQLLENKRNRVENAIQHICVPETDDVCNIDKKVTLSEKLDEVKRILQQRGNEFMYSEQQVVALANYQPPKGTTSVEFTQLERMAYGSTSIIENLGTVFVFWLFFFSFSLTCLCCNCFCCPCLKFIRFKKMVARIKKDLFWSAFIRFGIETYMEVAIAFQINIINYLNDINLAEDSPVHNTASFVLAVFLGAYVILFPIISIGFLIYNHFEIQMEQYNRRQYLRNYSTKKSLSELDSSFVIIRKYGTLFFDIKSKTASQLLYYPIFLLRRLILAIILVQYVDKPGMQSMLIIYLNLVFIIYIGYISPLLTRKQNKLEIFGEVINMQISYNFFVYSDFVLDYDTQFEWAFLSIGLVCILILVNMFIIILDYLKSGVNWYQRRNRELQQEQRQKRYNDFVQTALKYQEIKLAEQLNVIEKQDLSEMSLQDRQFITQNLLLNESGTHLTNDKVLNEKCRKLAKKLMVVEQANALISDSFSQPTSSFHENNRFFKMVQNRMRCEENEQIIQEQEQSVKSNVIDNSISASGVINMHHEQCEQRDTKTQETCITENHSNSAQIQGIDKNQNRNVMRKKRVIIGKFKHFRRDNDLSAIREEDSEMDQKSN